MSKLSDDLRRQAEVEVDPTAALVLRAEADSLDARAPGCDRCARAGGPCQEHRRRPADPRAEATR